MTLSKLLPRDVVLLLLVLVSAGFAIAEDEDFGSMSNEELVAALASTNQTPDVGEPGKEGVRKPPAGYNRAAQDRVYSAWNELLTRDESLLPALIAGLDDKRYSATEDTGPVIRNLRVRDVCLSILSAKIDANKRLTRQPDFPSYVYKVVTEDPQRWYADRKDKSFAELQIESYRWFLKQEPSEFITAANQQRVRDSVEKALAELENTKEPYQPPSHKPRSRF